MSMSIRSEKKQKHALSQLAELARISPLVVGRRTARMSQTRKSATNQHEAHLMVQEKVSASMESMVGMTMAALRIQVQPTPNPNFRRVDARIAHNGQHLLQLSTVVGRY